jgi:phosphoglycerate dehydrogenase-like enzyme
MKILVIGNRDRYEKFSPEQLKARESGAVGSAAGGMVFFPRGTDDDTLAAGCADAQIILADAISPVSGYLMGRLEKLTLVHSEGVAYDKIDLATAKERGVYVCNNKGCNAQAVAEQAVFLMLAFLRSAVAGHREVLAGRQIQMKERMMVEGITELGECTVGLVGFGDIARAAAKRLAAFGCKLCYYTPSRKPKDVEEAFGVQYLSLDDLAASSDIVSIHAAVTPDTKGMINAAFLNKMERTAFIVNTARGEIIDNEALRQALITGRIAGAAFDTIHPEPTPGNHPLVDLPEKCRDRVIYSPHLGGITTGSFRRAHKNIWENVSRIECGERPLNVVN